MSKSFFTTLTIEKTIKVNPNQIDEIKLLNEDKMIIIEKDKISIYDLLEEKFILNYPLINKLIYCKNEILGKDKLIVGITKQIVRNNFIIYQFLEDKLNNIYNLIPLNEISLSNNIFNFMALKILFFNNKIIIIGNTSFYIYEYKNNNPILFTKIKNNSYNKWINGFIFNKNIIGLLEGNNKLVHFYNIKKGKLIQQNILNVNNQIIVNSTILNLNDNDRILYVINNTILLYSFKKNKVLIKLEDKYNINCLTLKDNKIFYVGPYINILNLEKKEINRVSFYQYELEDKVNNNLIFIQNKIISNSKDKINIFNNSPKRTLLKYIKIIMNIIIIGLIIIYFLYSFALCIYVMILLFILILKFFGFNYYYQKLDSYMEKNNGTDHLNMLIFYWNIYLLILFIIIKLFY